MNSTRLNTQSGFTLIEIAAVVIIIGLLMVPIVQLYEGYQKKQTLNTTQENLIELNNLIASSRSVYHDILFQPMPHYPCPSDRSKAPGDPLYMKPFNNGDCTIAALKIIGLDYANATAVNPVCTPNFGFCMALGSPGTDYDGDGKDDPILIGGIPIAEIGTLVSDAESGKTYPMNLVLDGWGHQFTYAVSADLTLKTQAAHPTTGILINKQTHGNITLVDEHNQPTAGISGDAHYVIISHGANGVGSFSAQGAVVQACGGILIAKDNQNCNNDYTFVAALNNSFSISSNYYDDYIYAAKPIETGIWAPLGTTSIRNLNDKNVGIGTDTPLAKLDVKDEMKTDYNALTTQICADNSDNLGKNCFKVNTIAGNVADSSGGIQCPANTVMQGISQGQVDCRAAPAIATKATQKTCPSGQFIHGLNLSTGEPICSADP